MDRETLIQNLIDACSDLLDSEDSTGCSENLTVVELEPCDRLRELLEKYNKSEEVSFARALRC